MSVLPVGISGEAQYQISRSLRCNSADSTNLSRTPSSTSNRRTWTWNGWFKRTSTASNETLFAFGDNSTGGTDVGAFVRFDSNAINFEESHGGVSSFKLTTTQVFRDVSAWGMLTVAVDTTQATASNRIKLYWNGVQITTFSTATYPSQNFDTSANVNGSPQRIGAIDVDASLGGQYFNGYLTEVNFIDGQALTPSSFGETDQITGVWKPKKYTGTYGTNGFYLNFSDNSGTTATTLGKDYSGNGNNWTPNNFSVTAGAGNDSLVDVPTLWGSDTGAGGQVRGNYATLNSLRPSGGSLANGNLDFTTGNETSAYYGYRASTFNVPSSGKWYFEVVPSTISEMAVGLTPAFPTSDTNARAAIYYRGGNIIINGSTATTQATYTNGDVIGVALDKDANTIQFYKNNVAQGSAQSISALTGEYYFAVGQLSTTNSCSGTINFGQRPFAFSAPSGFKALVTTNLPDSAVKKGSDQFNVVLDTGANIKTASEALFPSNYFEWIKDRANANNHQLIDIVRGSTAVLQSNTTAAETTYSAPSGSSVGWVWKANGAGVTNTAGTITSTVSANTTSGFSIGTYTGTGANATVGHGLGVAPAMIIVKGRDFVENWGVYHSALGNTKAIFLNLTAAAGTYNGWNNTTPTSTVFSLGDTSQIGALNQNGKLHSFIAFAPVAGYSAFGSYTGNGSADGPFVFTGHRPRWILVKRTDSTAGWTIIDTTRDTYNATQYALQANQSLSEATLGAYPIDIVSNGFKVRMTATDYNANGGTFVYAAFAENPFKYSLAR